MGLEKNTVICIYLRIAVSNTIFISFVTLRMSSMEQELLTLLEQMSSPPGFNGVRVAPSLVLCVMFCRSLCHLVIFDTIVLSRLRFTVSNLPFSIFIFYVVFFSSTLTNFDHTESFTDTDVAIFTQKRTCLQFLWTKNKDEEEPQGHHIVNLMTDDKNHWWNK